MDGGRVTNWDWSLPEPKGQTKLSTVEDHLFWSYAMLSICRQFMRMAAAGEPYPIGGRTKLTNILMQDYRKGKCNISSLDRDDSLAQGGIACCAHCGAIVTKYHWDHLIPRNTLRGDYLALNLLRSCPRCNTSRGDKDLLAWHRQRMTFPSLGVLRRYMKLCFFSARARGILERPVQEAMEEGFPFSPHLLPRKFPNAAELVWDHAYPGAV